MDKKFKSESIEIHRLLMTKHEKRKLKLVIYTKLTREIKRSHSKAFFLESSHCIYCFLRNFV